MDDLKVDLVVPPEVPFHFQCKSKCGRVAYDKILEEMPDDKIRVILAKQTEKRKTRFYKTGEYAILSMEDFLKLIK